ncbi:PREDICTED: uncharacterized protein LOC106814855 [Priapulus caudatus]|uniref:Uncharacterized protein LOC106814855 n=1 Tax=Priapulus caudatus TaxID=37621 RepID=A0ABM1ER85_PRICU|nr:PREDICTED: uncharacterized protein LOC106814855 [Priapulus caudatus]
MKITRRFCNNPPPLNGGKICVGDDISFELCDATRIRKAIPVCSGDLDTQVLISPGQYASATCGSLSQLPQFQHLTGKGFQIQPETADDDWQPCVVTCLSKTKSRLDVSPGGLYYPAGSPCSESNANMFCAGRRCRSFDEGERVTASTDSVSPHSCQLSHSTDVRL